MLEEPVLLSTAAAIVHKAAPFLPEAYVLGHGRRFVNEGLIQPAATIGGGKNRRALVDSYGVARLAVLSVVLHFTLHMDDLPATADALNSISDNPSLRFRDVVDEYANGGAPDWYLHNHVTTNGKRRGSVSREADPNRISKSLAIASTRLSLKPILYSVTLKMRAYESN